MKELKTYISEAFKINKNTKLQNPYKYFPETKEELQDIIKQLIKERGNEGNFNDIDTSEITDMSALFQHIEDFNGNISEWNLSNVMNIANLFRGCKSFNRDISKWDVSNVTNMRYVFYGCFSFNQDISKWDVSNVIGYDDIFFACPIEEKYKPKFK